jgi:hypothetical protein
MRSGAHAMTPEAFCVSSSFEATRRRFELLSLVPCSAWTASHVTSLDRATRENRQIRDAILTDRRPAPDAVAALIGAVQPQAPSG